MKDLYLIDLKPGTKNLIHPSGLKPFNTISLHFKMEYANLIGCFSPGSLSLHMILGFEFEVQRDFVVHKTHIH